MEPNTIYLLSLTNGGCEYEDDSFDRKMITVPENIEYLNIITYAPHGCSNVETWKTTINKSIYFLNNQKDYCDKTGADLVNFLRTNEVLYENNLMNQPDSTSNAYLKSIASADTFIYKNNPQYVYSQIEYDTENKIQVPLKRWKINGTISYILENLFVICENNGELRVGTRLLTENEDTDTERILQLLSDKNYTRVVIIDYSCDVCITPNRNIVPRDIIISNRNKGGYKKSRKKRAKKRRKNTRRLF